MTSIAHGRDRGASDRLLRSAARGAVLIGVAVVIGIVLLQVVDNGSPVGGGTTQGTGTNNGVTTTTGKGGARSPQGIAVGVFNGSGVSGAGAKTANDLRGLGYQIVTVGNAPALQTGTTVACTTGFDTEAQQLTKLPSLAGSTIAAFPATPPAGAESANCIIIVGR